VNPLVIAAVLLAGAGAACLRYGLSTRLARAAERGQPSGFPWATLTVNVVASLLAGLVTGWTGSHPGAGASALQLIAVSGFCGGLSTFSTWSVETIELARGGRPFRAFLNIATNLVIGVAAAGVGLLIL
jgi:fluoride exporter